MLSEKQKLQNQLQNLIDKRNYRRSRSTLTWYSDLVLDRQIESIERELKTLAFNEQLADNNSKEIA